MATVVALSGQVTCTCAGKAVQFTSTIPGTYIIRPRGDNAGVIYVGNDGSTTGDVTSSNGYQLKVDVDTLIVTVQNLNQLWMDATTNNEVACWHRIMGGHIGNSPPIG